MGLHCKGSSLSFGVGQSVLDSWKEKKLRKNLYSTEILFFGTVKNAALRSMVSDELFDEAPKLGVFSGFHYARNRLGEFPIFFNLNHLLHHSNHAKRLFAFFR